MIQEISIKNFLSYKDKMTFSFLADPSTFRDETQVVKVGGVRLLRFAVLYGANAAGKTNFLRAVLFITTFLLKVPNNRNEKTGLIPFLLDDNTTNENSEFEIIFYINDQKYHYYLVVNTDQVVSEKLTIGKSDKIVFTRKSDGDDIIITYNIKLKQVEKEIIRMNCLKNMSVFAAYNRLNVSISEFQSVLDYFGNFMPTLTDDKDIYGYAAHFLALPKNVKYKEKMLKDFKSSDFENIIGYKFKINETTDNKPKITDTYTIQLKNGKEYKLPGYLISNGTQNYIGLNLILRQLLEKQSFITGDEIENSIHPDLFEKIIYDFLNAPPKNQSQMILATHYSGLMETVMIRPDSIHFVEKRDDGSSELFALTDFKDLKSLDSSIYKAYRDGRFGAVAKINYNDDRENNTGAKQ